MKRFIFSFALMLASVFSANAQCDFCFPLCELERDMMLSQCAMSEYPQIALSYYDYFTDGQDVPFPHDYALGTTQCEYEAELSYRLCIGACSGYYQD